MTNIMGEKDSPRDDWTIVPFCLMRNGAKEEVLSVLDVSCDHCVRAINRAIGKLPGVQTVETDIPTKSVHIRYDQSQLSLEQIEATLDDVGYTVAKGPVQTPRTSGKPLNLL